MKTHTWLFKNYPLQANELIKSFTEEELTFFKDNKFMLGKLNVDYREDKIVRYPAGTLCFYKRSNPIRDYNYPLTVAYVKSWEPKLTASGIHAISVCNREIIEISKAKL